MCHPQWGTFSGILSFDPHSFLHNKYHSHFINKASECLALRREGLPCVWEVWVPLMNGRL